MPWISIFSGSLAALKAKIVYFLHSQAPAVRARRYLLTKFIVFLLWWVAFAAIAAAFSNWFDVHKFVAAVVIAVAVVSLFAFQVGWRYRVSCPRCGWNINLKKTPYGSPGNRYFSIPSSCPNCGENLEAGSK